MARGGVMAEHTPGPWEVDFTQTIDAAVIAQVDTGLNVGEAYYLGDHDGELLGVANARLIAAAPEMEKALEAILAADERGQGLPFAEAMEAGKAALAKARGE